MLDSIVPLLPALVALLCTLGCAFALCSATHRLVPLDYPNERSLHRKPIPRAGGIAIAAGVVAGCVVMGSFPAMAGWALFLLIVSFADDHRSLAIAVRLPAHSAAAVGALFSSSIGPLDPVWIIVLSIAIVWMTNLFNFMDGVDGLATGAAVIGFSIYGSAAFSQHNIAVAGFAGIVATASIGFLPFNLTPARAFLGDTGSIPLGFLGAVLGILGWRSQLWPLWFPVVVFAPLIADASVTLLRRMLRGERFWRAHRSHYYQRLVLMGWTHTRVSIAYWILMILTGTVAVLARDVSDTAQVVAGILVALLLFLVGASIDIRWAQLQAKTNAAPAQPRLGQQN